VRLRDAACTYADRGWAVMPLKARQKAPLGLLVPHGMDDATSDLATVFGWWERVPHANVGINCEASGLVVLDVDPRNDGEDSLHDLLRELGTLPRTIEAHSGGGGQHILFRNPGGSFRREVGPGVDVKCSGYIVAPPSIHPSGEAYVWSVDGDPADVALAELPAPWLERVRVQTRTGPTPKVNPNSTDDLKQIAALDYAPMLCGREVDAAGWMQCPFHKGGEERTPSFRADGALWACYACEPIGGKATMGGNIYDLAALLWAYPVPLSPVNFSIVRSRLIKEFG
jgi:hypothetical protein